MASPVQTVELDAGAYAVTESLVEARFSADCAGSIAVGQTKTCTVTNTLAGDAGHIFVTGTTCQSFNAGTVGELSRVQYSVKAGKSAR